VGRGPPSARRAFDLRQMAVDAVDALVHDLDVVADEPMAGAAADGDAKNGDGADDGGPGCQFDQIKSPSCPAQLRGCYAPHRCRLQNGGAMTREEVKRFSLTVKKFKQTAVLVVSTALADAFFLTFSGDQLRAS